MVISDLVLSSRQTVVREVRFLWCLAQVSQLYWNHPVVLSSTCALLFSESFSALDICHDMTVDIACVPVVMCSALCAGLVFKPASRYLVRPSYPFEIVIQASLRRLFRKAPNEFLVRTVWLSLAPIHVLERHMENLLFPSLHLSGFNLLNCLCMYRLRIVSIPSND